MKKLDILESSVKKLETENTLLRKEVKNLTKDKNNLEDDIYYIGKDLASLQQYSRRWNVEVCNIPDDVKQEQLSSTLQRASEQMEVEIKQEDMEIVHRLSKPKKSNEPAHLIVHFKNRNKAFELMRNKAKHKI